MRRSWTDQILCAYYGGEFLYTQRIAITDRFKYCFNGFDIDELYDLHDDPEEMHNAAYDPKYAKYADDMRARLYEMMNRFEDPYGDVQARNSNGRARSLRSAAISIAGQAKLIAGCATQKWWVGRPPIRSRDRQGAETLCDSRFVRLEQMRCDATSTAPLRSRLRPEALVRQDHINWPRIP